MSINNCCSRLYWKTKTWNRICLMFLLMYCYDLLLTLMEAYVDNSRKISVYIIECLSVKFTESHDVYEIKLSKSHHRDESGGRCCSSVSNNETFFFWAQTQTEQKANASLTSERKCFWVHVSFDSFSMINDCSVGSCCVYACVFVFHNLGVKETEADY